MKTTFKFIFLFLITFSVFTTYAQDHIPEWKNQLKFSPLRVVDPSNPGIEFSFERIHKKGFSTMASVGLMQDIFNFTDHIDYSGIKLSLEEKYFFSVKNFKRFNAFQYAAMELSYLEVDYNTSSLFIKDVFIGGPKYLDTFNIAKQNISVNFKYGVQVPLNRFLIDISAGIGFKHKSIEREGVLNRFAYEVVHKHPHIDDLHKKEGKYITFNFPFNIRIGYGF